MPKGWSRRTSGSARRPGPAGPTRPSLPGRSRGSTAPDVLEAGHAPRRCPTAAPPRPVTSRSAASRRSRKIARRGPGPGRSRTPPGRTRPRPKRLPQSTRRHVQEVAADAAAERGGGQEADVAGQGAQVAGMVGQALQLQGDAPQAPARARGAGTAGQGLQRPGSRRWRGRWWCRRRGSPRGAWLRGCGPAEHGLLDAAVLVAQGDLQVEHLLAVALEAEVARLDDPGVDRADRHLVDLLALDPVEVDHARPDGLRSVAPGVAAPAARTGGSGPA